MTKKVTIRLNQAQMEKIERKLGGFGCDTIEVDRGDLINMIRYQGPQICIDFDTDQEQVIQEVFPNKECDFAVIDKSELPRLMKYMAPPSGDAAAR